MPFPRLAPARRVPSLVSFLPLLLLLLALSACGGGDGGTGSDPIVRVTLAGPLSVAVHETIDLTATAITRSGSTGAGSTTVWSSDRPAVAEVSVIGEVTGRSEGTATISCTIDGVTGTRTVTVTRAAVASVRLAPDTAMMIVGSTRAFTVTPRDVTGQAISGTFTMTTASTDASVAELAQGANQWMMQAKKPGTALVMVTIEGKSDTATVTVVPVPVASVTISPASALMDVGERATFTATLRDSAGAELTGRSVNWSSLDGAVAIPVGQGLVEATAPGQARIVARSEGKADTAFVTVLSPMAARVEINPAFTAVGTGELAVLQARALTPRGVVIPSPAVEWSTPSAGATVSAGGTLSAPVAGVYRAVARVDAATDTALVAVLGARTLLGTARPAVLSTATAAELRPGEAVTVSVTLHTSRVSAIGDVATASWELTYDPAVIALDSVSTAALNPTVDTSTPGVVRFSMRSSTPWGSSQLSLALVHFRVAAGAPVGAQRRFGLVFPTPPVNLSGVPYELPLTYGGKVRVIAP